MEPMVGIEPTTYGLRNRCSTTELHWHRADSNYRRPIASRKIISRTDGTLLGAGILPGGEPPPSSFGSQHFTLQTGDRSRQIQHVSSGQTNTAEVLLTHTPALFDQAVRAAADRLKAGEVVAVPTETVYGLAGNAFNPAAVAAIFQIKGRPAHNPIIVHVASLAMAQQCVARWPEAADRMARSFWPGPLTLVLPRADVIPDSITAGGGTVGIRWPSHPFTQALIRECGFPLAAPSANLSNELSPTNAAHVHASLGERLSLIVDGGQSQIGIESTVVDLTRTPAVVLRPGMIHLESLQAVLGEDGVAEDQPTGGEVLRSPGQLRKHYSPRARLRMLDWRDDADLRAKLSALNDATEGFHVIAHSRIPSETGMAGVSVIPHDAEAYARALYSELHRCDAAGAKCIVVETLPEGTEWRGISDRLQRAAG